MARGDHIQARRPGYTHDGIDCGDGWVIHLTAVGAGSKATAMVQRTTLREFGAGDRVVVKPYAPGTTFAPDEVVARARRLLGRRGYNLLANNCEHFARWCKTGDHYSEQVLRKASLLSGGSAAAVAATTGLAVAASMTAAHLNGAAQTTATLANVGGGSAVAGIVVLGALPMGAAVWAIERALADDPALPAVERNARAVGRRRAFWVGLAGLAAGVFAVHAAGSRGLDARGITSGLRSIGGDMASGVTLLGGGAALAAALAGWRAYINAGGNQRFAHEVP